MKAKGVNRFLESLGLSNNITNTQIPELRSINLRSNGNYSIDFRSDRLSFDPDLELIKIKKYNYRATSGIFTGVSKDGRILKFKHSLKHNDHPFRGPRIGDILFFVKKSNGTLGATTAIITELHSDYLVMNKTISYDISNYTVGYADPELYQDSSQDTLIPELLLQYSPKSSLTADIYIDYFAVTSFSARSEYFGI